MEGEKKVWRVRERDDVSQCMKLRLAKMLTGVFMSNGEVASFLWRNTADVMTLIRCLLRN